MNKGKYTGMGKGWRAATTSISKSLNRSIEALNRKSEKTVLSALHRTLQLTTSAKMSETRLKNMGGLYAKADIFQKMLTENEKDKMEALFENYNDNDPDDVLEEIAEIIDLAVERYDNEKNSNK